ncbi:glutaredoxin-C6-like [Magnolia sinica]|uniref:glutaredoxin-C6-like n=1 Tax=Magnolia sinica TaxID=86752 RepID=UPI00265994EE|nr:glutaredoxin-C6-like [Magnolia sinica]
MQRVRCRPFNDGACLQLTAGSAKAPLSIDVAETTEKRIQRLVAENPVIIFSRPSCCMCHVMKQLLTTLGVHPTVIELDEGEMAALTAHGSEADSGPPAVFIGGDHVGGLESLMALHLSGRLVPKIREVGAAWL